MLQQSTVADLVHSSPPLVTVKSDDSLERVLLLMKKHGITSVPVRHGGNSNEFQGDLSVLDILEFITAGPDITKQFGRSVGKVLKTVAVSGKMDKFGCSVEFPHNVANVLTLDALLEPFSKGVKKVLVERKENGEVTTHNLSQSDLVKYIFENPYTIKGEILDKTIDALHCYSQDFQTVTSSLNALETFKLMSHCRLPAVVVMKENELYTTVSASDLRLLTGDKLWELENYTITQYLHAIRHGPVRKVLTVKLGDTLREAISRMVKSGVHRVWVLDSNGTVRGVLGTSEICKGLRNYIKNASVAPSVSAATTPK